MMSLKPKSDGAQPLSGSIVMMPLTAVLSDHSVPVHSAQGIPLPTAIRINPDAYEYLLPPLLPSLPSWVPAQAASPRGESRAMGEVRVPPSGAISHHQDKSSEWSASSSAPAGCLKQHIGAPGSASPELKWMDPCIELGLLA